MLFKVQQPLGGDRSKALVYNEDRSIELFVEMDSELDRLFAEHGPRVFVEGEAHQGAFRYERVVSDPLW